jgi:hypothetical protein
MLKAGIPESGELFLEVVEPARRRGEWPSKRECRGRKPKEASGFADEPGTGHPQSGFELR